MPALRGNRTALRWNLEQDSIVLELGTGQHCVGTWNRTALCWNLEQDSIVWELGIGQHYVETAMTALCHNRTALLCWNRTA